MDKVEFGIKIEQMEKLKSQNDYVRAAEIADTIEWRKIKKWSELLIAEEIYEKAGREKDARNICVYAYNRNLGGRTLVYKLTELSINLNDLEEADDLYNEFVEMAPHDMSRYILLYKLNKARGVADERLIEILEEYKDNELDEKYEYELAELYSKAGRIEECVKECDDLILWFNDGVYVEKALELKKRFAELTPLQEEKLQIMREFSNAGLVYEASLYRKAPDEDEKVEMKTISEDEIAVPEKNYSIYDTQNIQAELAKSMADIYEEIKKEEAEEKDAMLPEYEEQRAVVTKEAVSEENVEEPEEVTPEEDMEEPEEVAPEEDMEEHEEVAPEEEQGDPQYDTFVNAELSATAEPLNIEVVELQVTDEDEVDEPTREIIINTHRWNQVKSELDDEESDGAFKIGEEETVQDEGDPVQMEFELEKEDAIVNGQVDLLYYLEHMDDPEFNEVEEIKEPENESVKDTAGTEDNFDRIIRETMDSGVLDQKETEAVDAAVDALTKRLIEEAGADIIKSAAETSAAAEAIHDTVQENKADEQEDRAQEAQEFAEDTFGDREYEDDTELTESEKKYINKYLFMEGMETSLLTLMNGKRREIPDGTSRHGNIIIFGNRNADRTAFAINLFKAMHADDTQRELRIAKTTSEILNRKGIASSKDKIKGTTFIIENADRLRKSVIDDLNAFMETDTGSMLVVFTGEEYLLKKIFETSPILRTKFDYVLELKHYTDYELVEYAKEYAREQGYSIDEKAIALMYILVDEFDDGDDSSQIDKIREMVDNAIGMCRKKPKKNNKFIPLKEKHFK